jgi:hypothetical protein
LTTLYGNCQRSKMQNMLAAFSTCRYLFRIIIEQPDLSISVISWAFYDLHFLSYRPPSRYPGFYSIFTRNEQRNPPLCLCAFETLPLISIDRNDT